MGLDPGRLRHAVNIQQKTVSQDATTGETTESWSTLHENQRAAIEPMSAREFLQSQADQSGVTVRITIRYLSGLDASMRLVGVCDCHAGKIYNPAGVLEDNESGIEWITLPCSQGVNQG